MAQEYTVGLVLADREKGGVPMVDVDGSTIEAATREAKRLQRKHNLGEATISETSKGHYHLLFFQDKLPFDRILEIQSSSKLGDHQHKDAARETGKIRPRVEGVSENITMVPSKHGKETEESRKLKASYLWSIRCLK